ncbi:MAG: hypothetical protein KF784_01515 [Fimbriimonadaceae bacterium]|nr:hypothetical protein [Fimbriimonadaceae bacterium]
MSFPRPLAALAFVAVFSSSYAQNEPVPAPQQPPVTVLDAKLAELKRLEESADSVVKKISELTTSGGVTQSDEVIAQLKRMVDELSEIRSLVKRIEQEVMDLRSGQTTQKSTTDKLGQDVSNLKKTQITLYSQFQYQDSDRIYPASSLNTTANDAFRFRRIRLGVKHQADERTGIRLGIEFANGTNQSQAQIRDAYVMYSIRPMKGQEGTTFLAGQRNMPLGYEIERSSSEREFPEQALYNSTLFNSETGRGVALRYGIDANQTMEVGLWNSLTINDPEQKDLPAGPGNRLAMAARYRYTDGGFSMGVSGFAGKRPAYSQVISNVLTTSPEVDRRFVYLDAAYQGLFDKNFTLRGEVMKGKDRVPSSTPGAGKVAHELSGFQIQAGYLLNARNRFDLRWEQFDPDLGSVANAINGYGLAWTHYLNPNMKFTFAHEFFFDEARDANASVNFQKRYQISTFRLQFRF